MNSNVIRIVNLGDNTTEQSLRQFIQQYISLQNIIENIFVNKDEVLGLVFAYVVFKNTVDALISVNKLDGFYFNYNVLEVELIGPSLKCKNYRQENIHQQVDLQQKINTPRLSRIERLPHYTKVRFEKREANRLNQNLQEKIETPRLGKDPHYSRLRNEKREARFNQNLQEKIETQIPNRIERNPTAVTNNQFKLPAENNFVQNPIRVPPSNVTTSQYSNLQNKTEPRFNQNLQQKTETSRPNTIERKPSAVTSNQFKLPAKNNFVQNPIRVPPSDVTQSQYSNIQNKTEPRFNQNLQQKIETPSPQIPNRIERNPTAVTNNQYRLPAENKFVQNPIRVSSSNVTPSQYSNLQNKTEPWFNQNLQQTPRPNQVERKPSAVTNSQFRLQTSSQLRFGPLVEENIVTSSNFRIHKATQPPKPKSNCVVS